MRWWLCYSFWLIHHQSLPPHTFTNKHIHSHTLIYKQWSTPLQNKSDIQQCNTSETCSCTFLSSSASEDCNLFRSTGHHNCPTKCSFCCIFCQQYQLHLRQGYARSSLESVRSKRDPGRALFWFCDEERCPLGGSGVFGDASSVSFYEKRTKIFVILFSDIPFSREIVRKYWLTL